MIQGVSESPPTVSFPAMVQRQQALAQVILKDPAVESLSSFIGIDGTNTTVNSGRFLINLKPLAQRKVNISEVIDRLQPQLAKVQDITLFLQPVQDLTVEDRVSRTQYQYSLEDPSMDELNTWTNKLLAKLKSLPELQDVATDQQNNGSQVQLVIDRSTASRLGISLQMIDDTLYDAFGQRQVSTMFTQLNQYHVVLEVDPEFQSNPRALRDIYLTSPTGGSIPLSTFVHFEPSTSAVDREPSGTVSGSHDFVQPGARLFARQRGNRDRNGPEGDRDAGQCRDRVPRHRAGLRSLVE